MHEKVQICVAVGLADAVSVRIIAAGPARRIGNIRTNGIKRLYLMNDIALRGDVFARRKMSRRNYRFRCAPIGSNWPIYTTRFRLILSWNGLSRAEKYAQQES